MSVNFEITEYEDGTCRIETHNILFHYRDGLFRDDVKPQKLLETMSEITTICNNMYNMGAVFTIA